MSVLGIKTVLLWCDRITLPQIMGLRYGTIQHFKNFSNF